MPDPAAPMSVSRLVLQAKALEIDAIRRLAGRAELVGTIGQLIHALQTERGATSVFLASLGQRFADVRRGSVDEARLVQARLAGMFDVQLRPEEGATARMLSLMAWSLLGLQALDDLRTRIDRQAVSAHDTVTAFSRLIAGLLELIFHVADATLLPRISPLLVALLHLAQGKETAGQERAVGALLFASGSCSEAHRDRLLHLIDSQERSLAVFREFADPWLRTRWDQQQLTPGMARLERLRRTLCTAKAGGPLDSNLSDAWFEVCSERIGDMWQLEVALVARVREECEAQIAEAKQDLQDSELLVRRLRDNPPAHSNAVERFFDIDRRPVSVPELVSNHQEGGVSGSGGGDAGTHGPGGHERRKTDVGAKAPSASLLELIEAQAAKLTSMEAELEAARRTLQERKVVERAKGVLMSRMGMSEEEALRALQKTSMDQNRRLVDVAEATLSLPDFAFARTSGGR